MSSSFVEIPHEQTDVSHIHAIYPSYLDLSVPTPANRLHSFIHRSLLWITVAETSPSSASVVCESKIFSNSTSPRGVSLLAYIDQLLRRCSGDVAIADAVGDD